MTQLEIPIIDLSTGTPKLTDYYPAVDVTDTTQSPAGTTKKYLISALGTLIGGGGGGGGGLTWNVITGTTQSAVINNGYIQTNAALTTVTLPATATPGQMIAIAGYGSAGFRLAQNAGQFVRFLNQVTSTGVGGSITSVEDNAVLYVMNTVANNEWLVMPSVGNFTIA